MPFFRSTDDRLGRLRKVLDRAHVHYSPKCPEIALSSVAVVDPPTRLSQKPGLQKFHFPLAMPARVAMFHNGFSADSAIRQFAPGETAQLKEYVPAALVLPLRLALRLADQKLRNLLELPALTRAIVVFTSPQDMPLADYQLTMIWHAFEVPVFEQFCLWDGTVVARECEVHDGLHIDQSTVVFQKVGDELIATQLTSPQNLILRVRTGLTASIVTEHCECGAETPRLRNLASLHAKVRLAVA